MPPTQADKSKHSRHQRQFLKRSATECAGIFDICKRIQIIDENIYLKSRELLMRIVAMLTKMAKHSYKE
jgi:hypothetical protein